MRLALIVAPLTVLVLLSCGPKKPPESPPPAPPAPAPPGGKTSYAFVFDPSNPALKLDSDMRFMRPSPRGALALPLYPDDALRAGDGPHHEIVRVVIDDQGDVASVGDSPLGTSDGGLYATSFRKAVDDAVHSWHFMPGVLSRVAPGNDLDGDGKADYVVTTAHEVVPVYYDVKFTFEIVDGRGIVRSE